MIIPSTQVVHISESKGRGVVATAPIPRGTVTWVGDELDREFTPAQFQRLAPTTQEIVLTYSYRNRRGNLFFCWDNERYINHSFRPNCCLTPYHFEIAVRDIAIGEELTNDYGFLNIIAPFAVEDEGTGRDTVYPDDLLRHSGEWDQLLAGAFSRLLQVEQPLRRFFTDRAWREAEAVASGRAAMVSIGSCYCPGKADAFLAPVNDQP
jgi:uncharacterized protein